MKEIFYSVPKVLPKCNFIRSATSMFDILSVFITVVISLNEFTRIFAIINSHGTKCFHDPNKNPQKKL